MAKVESLTNVPKKDVPDVVAGYLEDGATKVVVEKNPATGRWNVTATLPD